MEATTNQTVRDLSNRSPSRAWVQEPTERQWSPQCFAPLHHVLAIIDATSDAAVARLPTGNNSHSVAIDSASGLAFMSISSPGEPAACATCAAEGLAVFAIR